MRARKPAAGQNARQTILDVATQLFANQGFDAVTMRQISQSSGFSMPSIYHHFGNKEDLFKAVELEMYSAHAQKLLDQIQADATPEHRLIKFINAMFERLDNNPDYRKLLQRNLVDGWEENQIFLVETSLQVVVDELRQLLNLYHPGKGDGITPLAIFAMILGFVTMTPVIGHIKGDLTIGNSSDRRPFIDAVMDFIRSSTH
ncbi:TetR/AcrR family transcriptional regulator [Spongiibacter taiwanensis]|uniref:TetR/AcrR family transcriptional regulator n=1 Tax=Spongiibacter taiwanensis TaxID=1748242 RepID=UPI002035CBDD|nr:TetR/AcrR family transcriptional regulator [Spongiibacter taiwanensis]USA42634.1 TetR/AcrR family transcriptional regulator [Spongiibacter taiwanensis]